MADKPIPSSGFNLRSLNGVLKVVTSALNTPQPPAPPLPPPTILVGGRLRPGLSPKAIAARIISRQSESGRQVGNVFADGPNAEELMEVIRVEEIIYAILTEARVDVAIDPGIAVTAAGSDAMGIPVATQGATVSIGNGIGIIV